MFKTGDRVRCVGGQWYDDIGEFNTGIIKGYDSFNGYAIEWDLMPTDDDEDVCGHDCTGQTKEGYGYYVYGKDLELVKPRKRGNKEKYE